MTGSALTSAVDKFALSRWASVLAFAWGLAEATLFFIVPDVLLTLIACRMLKPALKATMFALMGALVGGALMYAIGRRDPVNARAFLDQIPAISPDLITRVASQISENGLLAVLLGPMKGIPYKIYAVDWGSREGSLITFMLISIPARYVRFFLAAVFARGIARLIEPLTHHRGATEALILACLWIGFYVFYFTRFGI